MVWACILTTDFATVVCGALTGRYCERFKPLMKRFLRMGNLYCWASQIPGVD